VREDGVCTRIDLDPAGEARALEQRRRAMALLFEVAVEEQRFHAGELQQDAGAVLRDLLDLAGEEVGMGCVM